jgi:hypothetical protein
MDYTEEENYGDYFNIGYKEVCKKINSIEV